MMINLYWELGDTQANRASLLATFSRMLLAREGLADR